MNRRWLVEAIGLFDVVSAETRGKARMVAARTLRELHGMTWRDAICAVRVKAWF